MSLVNYNNFLRWDDGNAPSSVEDDIPNGYIRDSTRCDYKPLMIASEALRFYINALSGLAWIDNPNTHKLALINEWGTMINADIAPLQVHSFDIVSGTVKTFYAEVIIDGTVPQGSYYFQVKTAGGVVKLTSNKVYVFPSSGSYKDFSALAKFRHDRYFYGINYQTILTFYQQFRLHLNQIDRQFEEIRDVYREVTTGKEREYNNFMSLVKTVETYFFDKNAHDAASVMFGHSEVFINLKRYRKKAPYKSDYDIIGKIYKGSIDVFDEEFASANRCTT